MFKCFSKADPSKIFAVKVTRQDDEEKKRASRSEYELTKGLNHPNITKSYDIFENETYGEIHLVIQYEDGEELSAYLARTRPDLNEVKDIMK